MLMQLKAVNVHGHYNSVLTMWQRGLGIASRLVRWTRSWRRVSVTLSVGG